MRSCRPLQATDTRNDTLPICSRADGVVGGTNKLDAAWDPIGVVDGVKQDSREANQCDTTIRTTLGVTDGAEGGWLVADTILKTRLECRSAPGSLVSSCCVG
jgi:hypothetical protein